MASCTISHPGTAWSSPSDQPSPQAFRAKPHTTPYSPTASIIQPADLTVSTRITAAALRCNAPGTGLCE